MDTSFKLSQPENILSPIFFKLFGNITFVSPDQANAQSSIVVSFFPSSIYARFSQSIKALLEIISTLSGHSKNFKDLQE